MSDSITSAERMADPRRQRDRRQQRTTTCVFIVREFLERKFCALNPLTVAANVSRRLILCLESKQVRRLTSAATRVPLLSLLRMHRSPEPVGNPLNRPPGTFSPTSGEGQD